MVNKAERPFAAQILEVTKNLVVSPAETSYLLASVPEAICAVSPYQCLKHRYSLDNPGFDP